MCAFKGTEGWDCGELLGGGADPVDTRTRALRTAN